jgi:hypothetical protein
MQIEVVVNEDGKIIAAVEPRPATLISPSASGRESPLAQAMLHARPGQTRHVLTVPAELAGTPLKTILQMCRFVSDADGPRLEKVTSPDNSPVT